MWGRLAAGTAALPVGHSPLCPRLSSGEEKGLPRMKPDLFPTPSPILRHGAALGAGAALGTAFHWPGTAPGPSRQAKRPLKSLLPGPRSPSVSPGRGGLRFSPHHPAAIPARLPHPNRRLVPAPAVPRSDDATRRAPPLPRQATPNAAHDYHDPSPALRETAASARLAPAAASRPPPQGAGRARAAPSEPGGTSRTKPPLAHPPLAT